MLVTSGLGLLGTLRYDTAYWHVAIFMALLGLGVGMMMQNLVLCTQNQVAPSDLGAASSVVTFFRSLGGAIGVSALGAVLSHRITHYAEEGLARLGVSGSSTGHGEIPDLDALPTPIRTVIESSYGHGIGDVFLYAAPFAALALVFSFFIKEVPLRTTGALAQAAQGRATGMDGATDVPDASPAPAMAMAMASVAATSAETEAPATAPATASGAASAAVPVSGDGGGIPVRGHVRGAERARAAGRRHPDLARRAAARQFGRGRRRGLRGGRARRRVVRPDRGRRRVPAAGVHRGRERRAGRVRHPAERDEAG